MTRRVLVLLGLLGLPVLGQAATAAPEAAPDAAPWPSGTWALCDDPDGGAKDHIQFNADGSGLSLAASGHQYPLAYKVDGTRVDVIAEIRGHHVPLAYTTTPARDKLMFYSPRTKSTAIYVRQGTETKYHCPAR